MVHTWITCKWRLAVTSKVIKTKNYYHCAVQKSDVHQSYSSLPTKSLILVFLIWEVTPRNTNKFLHFLLHYNIWFVYMPLCRVGVFLFLTNSLLLVECFIRVSSNSLLLVVGSFNSGLHKLGHLNLEGCAVTAACLEVISGLYLFLGILCHQLTFLRKYLTFSLKKSPSVCPWKLC